MKYLLFKFVKRGIKETSTLFCLPYNRNSVKYFSKINYGFNIAALSNYNETI